MFSLTNLRSCFSRNELEHLELGGKTCKVQKTCVLQLLTVPPGFRFFVHFLAYSITSFNGVFLFLKANMMRP